MECESFNRIGKVTSPSQSCLVNSYFHPSNLSFFTMKIFLNISNHTLEDFGEHQQVSAYEELPTTSTATDKSYDVFVVFDRKKMFKFKTRCNIIYSILNIKNIYYVYNKNYNS